MIKRIALLIVLLLVSSTVAASVDVQYEKNADYAKYKTFTFQPGTPAQDPVVEKEIHDAVMKNLLKHGLKYKKTGTADLNVVTHAALIKKKQAHVSFYDFAVPNSFEPWDQREVRTEVKNAIDLGTLIIEMVDAKSGEIILRATCAENLGPDRAGLMKKIGQDAEAVFGMYPPK